MDRFDTDTPLPAPLRNGVVALGSFDGLHRGHQALISQARQVAAGRPLILACFEPHPRRLFAPDSTPFRLTLKDERAALLAAWGTVDGLVEIPFDQGLASQSADAFIADWLRVRFGAAVIVAGEDYRFGHGRAGDMARLRAEPDLQVVAASAVCDDSGRRYASSAIRAALVDGDCNFATASLGRDHAICDVVTMGDQRGRQLGFPTANLLLGERLVPRLGVYAGRATLRDGTIWPAVSNLGVRPTFNGTVPRLETHIIGFDGDLYGQVITVTLAHFIRAERKFDGLDALRAQISADRAAAAAWLSQHRP